MRLFVQYLDGSLRAAVLQASFGSRLRVFIPGFGDAVEFRLEDGHWFDETGNAVEIQFDVPDEKFAKLVQDSAEDCGNRSDALEVYLWSLCVPQVSSSASVN